VNLKRRRGEKVKRRKRRAPPSLGNTQHPIPNTEKVFFVRLVIFVFFVLSLMKRL
jgi:hypothetical protein